MSKTTRNVGIVYPGLKPPERSCSDKKCPWHGNVSVRGVLFTCRVVKAKMHNTLVVEREHLVWVRKFKRYERKRSRLHVHNPPCINAKEGDTVLIGETRPLAKSVSFVILGILQRKSG
ncbi:MAG: 30S ribosomal protein S17 [Ignisphaera sp.]|nr:30S ribosomal protein S17 [Ignisphaera sp.]MCX8168489.1 30S ribosomal protein S17 [Ignisphaera sp.]MDW8085071.1 30S ribosomal protein S17 [Ignisphaera sp.]